MAQLSIATCQFPVDADVRKNGKHVRRQMKQAKKRGADVAHFPETCLSGYAGSEFASWDDFDWDALLEESEAIRALAKELKLWVVLGSSHRLSKSYKPHNSLYIISAAGRVVDRYDKRFCTGGDLKHYEAGVHQSIFKIKGVTCGALICYEVRFPELYRRYQQAGVQVMFHSFYNARAKKDTIHTVIMRPTLQGHAASNYMHISVTNAATPHQCWPSVYIVPDGRIKKSLKQNQNGIMVNTVDTKEQFYDASGPYRTACIKGAKGNNKRPVRDQRSSKRNSF